jgi:MurNAc alpha-1-phosphate uridylyltransferase
MMAMILAAGRGERMRELSDHMPKPLLEVGGKPLIQYHIEKLVAAGVSGIVVNHGRLGHLIEERFGDGSRYGTSIRYSAEGEEPLDTGGGIYNALPLLGETAFAVVNADVWTDYPYARLLTPRPGLAHIVLVTNPPHHPSGDFGFASGVLDPDSPKRFTYSGLGVYRPQLFRSCRPGRFPLAPLIRSAAASGQASAELYSGIWIDVGTPERLDQLVALLSQPG